MNRFPIDPSDQAVLNETRRQFFARGARGLGVAALSSMMADDAQAIDRASIGGLPGLPHFAPQAKRAIYLHMVGAPPQHDLLDYKPTMKEWFVATSQLTIRKLSEPKSPWLASRYPNSAL